MRLRTPVAKLPVSIWMPLSARSQPARPSARRTGLTAELERDGREHELVDDGCRNLAALLAAVLVLPALAPLLGDATGDRQVQHAGL